MIFVNLLLSPLIFSDVRMSNITFSCARGQHLLAAACRALEKKRK